MDSIILKVSCLAIVIIAGVLVKFTICKLYLEKKKLRRLLDSFNKLKSNEINIMEFKRDIIEKKFDYYDILIKIIKKYEKDVNSIDDDFNEYTLLYKATNRKLAESVPGVLTALGILGTFIGLTISLASIGKTLDPEAISAIIEGLKTAFYTSILGIVFSLVFNFLDKKILDSCIELIDEISETLHEILKLSEKDEKIEIITNYQKEQTQILKTLMTDFSAQLENVLVPGIKEGIASSFLPSMEKMENMIQSFANSATSNQVEGVNSIVDKFLDSMNNSLNGQFEELGKTIEDITQWQKKSTESISNLLDEIKLAAINQSEINKTSLDLLNEIKNYQVGINALINNINENNIATKEIAESFNSSNEFLNENIKLISESTERSNSMINEYIKNMADSIREFEKITNNFSIEITEANEKVESSSKEFSENIHTGLVKSFEEFDKNILEFVRHFQSNMEDLKETSNSMGKLILDSYNGIDDSYKKVERVIDNLPNKLALVLEKTEK